MPDSPDPTLSVEAWRQGFLAPTRAPRAAGADPAEVARAARIPLTVDRESVRALLAWDAYDVERSFFTDLALVPPLAHVTAEPGGRLRVDTGRAPARRLLDAAATAVALREAIDAAVEDVLAPAQGAAVWLSGGLDSSAVAVSAAHVWREHARDPKRLGFYHVLPRWGPDERAHAEAVAARLGHRLTCVRPTDADPFEGTERLYALLPTPPDGPGPRFHLDLSSRMRDDGVEVFLTGDGGDELFDAAPRRTWRSRLGLCLPDALWRRLGKTPPLPRWLERPRPPRPRLHPAPRAGLRGVAAWRDARTRSARQSLIVTWLHALGATSGLTVGVPLLDRRVVDLAVAIPQRLHEPAPLSRPLLRRAYAGRLPERVARRGKDQPLVEPELTTGIGRHAAGWFERWLRRGRLVDADVLDAEEARAALDAAASGTPPDVYRALGLVNVEVWLAAQGLEMSRWA